MTATLSMYFCMHKHGKSRYTHELFKNDRLKRGCDLRKFTQSRLTEISGKGGGACLTAAFSLVQEAQARTESVLWLSSPLKPFYPPDAVQNGVDLTRLPVLFLSRPQEAFLASAKLLAPAASVWSCGIWLPGRNPNNNSQ